ncbi:unnamed protein product, partial [marine sediment metagenome]
ILRSIAFSILVLSATEEIAPIDLDTALWTGSRSEFIWFMPSVS